MTTPSDVNIWIELVMTLLYNRISGSEIATEIRDTLKSKADHPLHDCRHCTAASVWLFCRIEREIYKWVTTPADQNLEDVVNANEFLRVDSDGTPRPWVQGLYEVVTEQAKWVRIIFGILESSKSENKLEECKNVLPPNFEEVQDSYTTLILEDAFLEEMPLTMKLGLSWQKLIRLRTPNSYHPESGWKPSRFHGRSEMAAFILQGLKAHRDALAMLMTLWENPDSTVISDYLQAHELGYLRTSFVGTSELFLNPTQSLDPEFNSLHNRARRLIFRGFDKSVKMWTSSPPSCSPPSCRNPFDKLHESKRFMIP